MTLFEPVHRRRVILDTDAKNEADDQFAIVHALLTPSFDIRGIIPAHFGRERTSTSMKESRAEVDLLLQLMEWPDPVTIADGAPDAMPDELTPVDSPGARLIIDEAHKEGSPLWVAFLGPLTDMASAILLDPTIVNRDVIVVWIGGGPYRDRHAAYWPEFNLRNDIHAANVVFESGMTVYQVPMSTYVMVAVGYAELLEKVAPCGAIGAYLVDQTMTWNSQFSTNIYSDPFEARSLGDSLAIGIMMYPANAAIRLQSPVRFAADGGYEPSERGRPIHVVENCDTRHLLEDMFAQLKAFAAQRKGSG